jgi:hypothetical protein
MRFWLLALPLLLCIAYCSAASARVEERRALQPLHELPAAVATWPQSAPLLSSLEYSAIAPPGAGLYPIEDEPYLQLQGSYHKGLAYPGHALTSIHLVSHIEGGGSYEAVVSLRGNPQKGDANPLRYSFDLSAASMVRRAQLFPEQRLADNYLLTELRSPLGLTDPRDKENRGREYLGYQAELINPLTLPLPPGSAQYTRLAGELRLVRVVKGVHYLLTVEFNAVDYPWALNLTRNIAGLVLEQYYLCEQGSCLPSPLVYGAEWYWPSADAEQLGLLDSRSADLLEQPDSRIRPERFPAGNPTGVILPRLQELPVMPEEQRAPLTEPSQRTEEELGELMEPFANWIDEPQISIPDYDPYAKQRPVPQPAVPEVQAAPPANAVPVQIEPPAHAAEPTVAIPEPDTALPDASAMAPVQPEEAEPHAEPKLPRLFEGWGSPRSTARPASRDLLNPFVGWLHDPPVKIVARIADQIKRQQIKGR